MSKRCIYWELAELYREVLFECHFILDKARSERFILEEAGLIKPHSKTIANEDFKNRCRDLVPKFDRILEIIEIIRQKAISECKHPCPKSMDMLLTIQDRDARICCLQISLLENTKNRLEMGIGVLYDLSKYGKLVEVGVGAVYKRFELVEADMIRHGENKKEIEYYKKHGTELWLTNHNPTLSFELVKAPIHETSTYFGHGSIGRVLMCCGEVADHIAFTRFMGNSGIEGFYNGLNPPVPYNKCRSCKRVSKN